MGKMQRNKGASFERLVAKKIAAVRPDLMAKRGLGQARSASEVPDVDVPGLWIECKHHIKVDVDKAMEQAERVAGDRTPVVVYRHNRGPIRVRVQAFIEIDDTLGMEELYLKMIDIDLEDWLDAHVMRLPRGDADVDARQMSLIGGEG